MFNVSIRPFLKKRITIFIYLITAFSVTGAPVLIEAEDGILTGALTVQTTTSGYSGSGYVGNFSQDGDKVTVTVNAPSEGSYTLQILYSSPYGDKEQNLFINGTASGKVLMTKNTGFDTLSAGVWLNAGSNTVSIEKSWGFAYVDAFLFEMRPPNVYDPTTTLIDPQATPEAKVLYARIRKNYGTKIISGLHDRRQNMSGPYTTLDSLKNVVSTLPLLRSFDFSDYCSLNPWKNESGTKVLGYVGDLSRETEGMIDWHTSTGGVGIIEITWHWHAPIAEAAGQNNFYTKNVNFDVREAVKTGTQENIKVLEDIDSISMQMKRLADNNIPVLWRPIHEAGGAWFWWGAHGAEAAIALWDIVYDRMVNHHDLHNMIWVWSTPEEEWYPGNSKVDIIGYDSYPEAYDYGSQKSMFDQLYDITAGEKIVAMTECGPIPDIDALIAQDAPWAWWSTWQNFTFNENSQTHLIDVYGHSSVIKMDNVSTIQTKKSFHTMQQPKNMRVSNQGGELFIHGFTKGEWQLFSPSGKLISAGSNATIPTQNIAAGIYHLRINKGPAAALTIR